MRQVIENLRLYDTAHPGILPRTRAMTTKTRPTTRTSPLYTTRVNPPDFTVQRCNRWPSSLGQFSSVQVMKTWPRA